jgi:hypothetical protein
LNDRVRWHAGRLDSPPDAIQRGLERWRIGHDDEALHGGTLRELVGGSKPIPSRSPRVPFNLNQQRKDQEHEQRTDGGADS